MRSPPAAIASTRCEPADIWWDAGITRGKATPLTLAADDHHWYAEGAPEDRALKDFAAVLMRKDPPFDMEYVYATYLLEAAERAGARVFNRPRAIRDNNEKMAIARFREFISPTLRYARRRPHRRVHRRAGGRHRQAAGRHGRRVDPFRIGREGDPNRNVIVETVSQHGARTVMAQRFIPEIVDGDKRILLIAGKVVPFCLARIPKPGETRGNLAAGGRGEARPLTARDLEIGEALAPALWADGLLVVGIDVIGPRLTEVNVTSPTCFVEIAEQTGFDVGGMFADALLAACAAPAGASR